MRQNTLAPWAELVPDTGPMTADDLLALPEDEWKYELVEGRLVRMPPTGLEHFDITDALHAALRAYVRAHALGIVTLPDTGFRFIAPDQKEMVLSPDVAFVNAARVAQLPPPGDPARKKFPPLAPDLAAEVASPDQFKPEMAEKAKRYLEAGTRLVWIVWPATRQVDVWQPGQDAPVATLGEGETLDGGQVVPGFALAIAEIFA